MGLLRNLVGFQTQSAYLTKRGCHMKSTESMESRLERVDMHTYFLNRINVAMENRNYIEASWLIYACFENRYYRMVEKIRDSCKYCRSKSKCNKKGKNELALVTKIKCIQRLYEQDVPCIKNAFRDEIFTETTNWIAERNSLMHELLSLEFYQNTDERFKQNAEKGLQLLNETYTSCTEFRRLFYDKNYIFKFPEVAMDKCACKPKEDSAKNSATSEEK